MPELDKRQGGPVIVIKDNNVITNDPCAICGQRTDPRGGPDLFLEGTGSLVCDPCGWKYAPAETAIVLAFHKDAAPYDQYHELMAKHLEKVDGEQHCGDAAEGYCPRCGVSMRPEHHPLCQARDGTPTALTDQVVRLALSILRDDDCPF